jgi:hypothetical protein
MNEFINPKSMTTPGAAGTLMMLLANTVCAAFPEVAFRYVALMLSFMIGSIVFKAAGLGKWERGAYWFINSLIIFSMGVGTSNIAANVTANPNSHAALERAVAILESSSSIVAATANAQEPTGIRPASSSTGRVGTAVQGRELEDKQALLKEIEQLRQQNQALQQQKMSIPKEAQPTEAAREQKAYSQQGFFKKW